MENKNTPYSNMKIFRHYDELKNLEDDKRCSPIYIRIKPTNKCNHNCSYCHYRNPYLTLDEYNYDDYIEYNKMMEIVSDIKSIGVKAVTFSGGGEPLLYPYINETMQKILDSNIELSIITNGTMLKGESAKILSKSKWVRISIDASNDKDYCELRGIKPGAFEDLCLNIQNFAKIKENTCELGINFVVGKENHLQIYEVGKLMQSLGVNHIKFAPMINNDTENYHASFKHDVIEQIHRLETELQTEKFKIIDLYSKDFDNYEVFKRTYTKCYIKEFVCVIAANAKVYYCHDKAYLKDGVVGDLNITPFRELWFSEEVTKKFCEFDAITQCNHHCVYDDRNILLNSFFDLDKNHTNFI